MVVLAIVAALLLLGVLLPIWGWLPFLALLGLFVVRANLLARADVAGFLAIFALVMLVVSIVEPATRGSRTPIRLTLRRWKSIPPSLRTFWQAVRNRS
ncbi:MAG: hypothetical protein ACHQQ3_14325 [Gemmatimonadales bacterium]